MTRYRVGLTQKVIEECTVYVEVDSPDEAEAEALKYAESGDLEWRFLEAICSFPKVVSIELCNTIEKTDDIKPE